MRKRSSKSTASALGQSIMCVKRTILARHSNNLGP
jgi:hypothetical protein